MSARLLSCVFALLVAGTVRADVVLDWNQITSETMLANQTLQNPGMGSRTYAMVNIAIHDAVVSVLGTHDTFYRQSSPAMGASVDAAVAAAAHHVLSSIYPDQQAALETALNNSLAGVTDANARTLGIAFGTSVGQQVVNKRQSDGFNQSSNYLPTGEIGRWAADPMNPTQEAWGPAWGDMKPFALRNAPSLAPPANPSLTSEEYADAFNQVVTLGALNNSSRTDEQTQIGLFWAYDRVGMGSPMRLYNSIVQTIANDHQNDLEENARLFALTSVAMADAGIVAWDSKFDNDLWRPVTGIRAGDDDGNPDTAGVDDWVPLGAPGGGVVNDFTPPFPSYVSGHSTFGGAVFQAIANFYGTDDISFSVVSDELPGVVRSFTSLSDAMRENGLSRIYLGVHWNFDDIIGQETGMAIADSLFANNFTAIPEPSSIAIIAGALGCITLWRRCR